eukprot:6152622-Prymnesium_polylepis.2
MLLIEHYWAKAQAEPHRARHRRARGQRCSLTLPVWTRLARGRELGPRASGRLVAVALVGTWVSTVHR